MPFATTTIGARFSADDVKASTERPSFTPGTTVLGNNGRTYTYIQAPAGGLTADARCTVAASNGVATAAATGRHAAVAAIGANGYGWAYTVENYTAAAGTTTVATG